MLDAKKYPILSKILSEAETVEAGWKQTLIGLLLSLGFSDAFANTNDLHQAIKGLNGKKIGSVQMQVLKNAGGRLDIKVGDFHVEGIATGWKAGDFASKKVDLNVTGPEAGGKGLEEAKFLMNKIIDSSELEK